jgi:hypothetical protein
MRSFVVAVVACAGLLAGCGSVGPSTDIGGPARQASPAGAGSPSEDTASFRDRAVAVAKAWQDGGMSTAWNRGFVPLQELTVEPAWTPNGDLKASYGNGWIRSASPLPDTAGKGEVRFADGASLPTSLVGAQTAYNRFPKRTGTCPMGGQPLTCQWLTITAARLSTVEILTTRGRAIVPAWHFTVSGVAQPLISVAVAPSAMTPIPRMTLPRPRSADGLVGAMDLASSSGRVVAFKIGIGACDKDPRGLVLETPELVVVGGSVTRPDPGTLCTAQLVLHPVEVRTKQPVGRRPVVDAISGQPLLTPAAQGH